MILIADSGSTKTDWRLIDSQRNIFQFSTIGFNPYFQDVEAISDELRLNLLPKIKLVSLEEINSGDTIIHFYGAGCSCDEKCDIVKTAILQVFPEAMVEVEHDLLAAARALCGKNKGIAAIMGTGSNSCYYNGERIEESVASLGYILGDEGSGAYIGKRFIQDYLNNDMPKNISKDFFETYKLSKDYIFEAIYKKPMPSKFLASFSKFIYQNQNDTYVHKLIINSFDQFFDKHICKYSNYQQVKMSCVGSVAYYYRNKLRSVADSKGVTIDKIIESPISGLTLYHLQKKPVFAFKDF